VTAGRDAVVKVSSSLAVRCAFLTYRLPTDWYLPATEPRGLVWAQHGFVESRKVWADFAVRAARAGFLVVAPTLPTADLFGGTVQNLGNNTLFLGMSPRCSIPRRPTAAACPETMAAARP
jgi:hypothetical protein